MSEISRFGRQLRDFLSGLLDLEARPARPGTATAEPPTGGTTAEEPMEKFPPAGIDRVRHDLRISLMEDDGSGERELEVLEFEGHMTLERGEPYTNENGLRQIDFQVLSWTATAWSKVLQQEILYVLSDQVERQPRSSITAEQKDGDFPATFEFNVIFDARANNRPVHHGHHGRPWGHGFRVVPPTGNRETSPTIYGFEDTVIRLEHPERKTVLIFRPKDCNDQSSQTVLTRADARTAA
jgi:hypothetical protein